MSLCTAKLRATALAASARCKLWWMTPTWGYESSMNFLNLSTIDGGQRRILKSQS